jgi:hypothetical protein
MHHHIFSDCVGISSDYSTSIYINENELSRFFGESTVYLIELEPQGLAATRPLATDTQAGTHPYGTPKASRNQAQNAVATVVGAVAARMHVNHVGVAAIVSGLRVDRAHWGSLLGRGRVCPLNRNCVLSRWSIGSS